MVNSEFWLSLAGGLALSLVSVSLMLLVTFKCFPDLFYSDRIRPHHYRILRDAWGRYDVQWAYWWLPLRWHTAPKCGPQLFWGVPSYLSIRTLEAAEKHLRELKRSHVFRPVQGRVLVRKS